MILLKNTSILFIFNVLFRLGKQLKVRHAFDFQFQNYTYTNIVILLDGFFLKSD